MNKFVLGALALTAASTPAMAGDDWSDTDHDLAALANSMAPAQSGATVTGFLRSSYANSGDFTTVSGNDLGGFSIDDARLIVTGSIANFSVLIETEGSTDGDQGVFGQVGGTAALAILDAYAAWNMTEELKLQMGQFRPPFLHSSMVGENNLLFMDRTLLGNQGAFRDQGVGIGGNWGIWGFMASLQNGADSAGDDLAIAGRLQVTPMGQMAAHEGALGATGDPSLMVGVGYYQDDGTIDDRVAFGVDVYFTTGIFSASAEMVDFDQGIGLVVPDQGGGTETIADASPWNVSVGIVAMPDQLEFGVRYEDLDDDEDTTVVTVGANWYMQGHAAKWQADFSTADSDDTARDGDVIQVGLTVSI
jgi:hypothetical protein